MTVRDKIVAIAALGLAAAPLGSACGQSLLLPNAWLSAGNGATDDHYSPYEVVLGPTTVPFLGLKWTFTADGDVEGTPTVHQGSVYFSDNGGSVWKVNAATGKAIWKASLPAITGVSGSYSRVSPAIGDGVIVIGDDTTGTVVALSQSTGALVWKTVLATNQGALITASPVVVNGRVYVGVSSEQETLAAFIPGFVVDFRGSVASLDEATGKVIWQTYTVPTGFTGGAVWESNLALDTGRNALYVTTGNNYSVPSSVAACQKAAGSNQTALAACLPSTDHIDGILSFNAGTGAVNWAQRFEAADTATTSCIEPAPATPCPTPTGPDADFGSAANLFSIISNGKYRDVVGAGQKSGAYYTLDRDTGQVVWGTQAGPGGQFGGVIWGTATDGQRIYIPEANSNHVTATLLSGKTTTGGFWTALDAGSGKILWQTPTTSLAPPPAQAGAPTPPPGALAANEGSVTVANGVMYGEDSAGNLRALNAATGATLFNYATPGAGIAGPAIADGTLFWASGYYLAGPVNNKVYAFSLGGE